MNDLKGLLEFTRRHPKFRPLVVCGAKGDAAAESAGIPAISWREFLVNGPPGVG